MTLYLVKHCGVDALRPLFVDIDQHDLAFVDDLALSFLDRYNPNVTGRLPAALHVPMLDTFHDFGIYPYDEHDWHEYHLAGELIAEATARRAAERATARRPYRARPGGSPERQRVRDGQEVGDQNRPGRLPA
jgi:hypothetical protein